MNAVGKSDFNVKLSIMYALDNKKVFLFTVFSVSKCTCTTQNANWKTHFNLGFSAQSHKGDFGNLPLTTNGFSTWEKIGR